MKSLFRCRILKKGFWTAIAVLPAIFLSISAADSMGAAATQMQDYCQVPPHVVQSIPPNIMILLDTSGSMKMFAYTDGIQTPDDPMDDNGCTSRDTICHEYNYPNRPASHRYYGYFEPDKWYVYGNGNEFRPNDTRVSNSWRGDLLNWLTMRRIDVMRKILTGGTVTGNYTLTGQGSDDYSRGWAKGVTAEVASANTPYNHPLFFSLWPLPWPSTEPDIEVYRPPDGACAPDMSSCPGVSVHPVADWPPEALIANMRTIVHTPTQPEGVLQRTVGARARVGLARFYNLDDEGGQVVTDVGGSLPSIIEAINKVDTVGSTPVAEALWSVVGYFAQKDSFPGFPGTGGPLYHSGDYTINPDHDPMNFGTVEGNPRYPVCQKNFVLLLSDGDPCTDGHYPAGIRNYANGRSAFNCVLGDCPEVRDDNNVPYPQFPQQHFASPDEYEPIIPPGKSLCHSLFVGLNNEGETMNGSEAGLEDVALFMHTNDLRENIPGFQNLTLFSVFAFGSGSVLMKHAAVNGGFDTLRPGDRPSTRLPSNWDKNGDGIPDNYFEASDGALLEQAVQNAFTGILRRATSGTAASVLASGEGSGANIIQAMYYPSRAIGNDVVHWTGSLQNLWYYIDPFFTNSSILEDTGADNVLDFSSDYIVQFEYDAATQSAWANRWSSDSHGNAVAAQDNVSIEGLRSLWEAGSRLSRRNLTTRPRDIRTVVRENTLDNPPLVNFSVANVDVLFPLMLEARDNAVKTVEFVTGIDHPDLRSRTVTFGASRSVWKLGDIVNSSPKTVAGSPLNQYHVTYFDQSYREFIENTMYKDHGMVFVGGNDGMLHAFKLGKLEYSWLNKTPTQKVMVSDPDPASPVTLGDEKWAFIPKNVLPYLKYLKDPDYCHLYYVDLAPYVFDASIGGNASGARNASSWRRVLIGGMRTGGACAANCSPSGNCVRTPDGGSVGYSSYFALDVTNPTDPVLLWEFAHKDLGFATTGPAIVRRNAGSGSGPSYDTSSNGEWYVVFGSGPTGPINSGSNQFLGRSNQNLRFFVLDLKTGALVQTIDTGITEAFAGSMVNSVADFDLNYQDDAIYVGYVKKSSDDNWHDGGVGRILTKNIAPSNSGGSNGWEFSKVIDGIGPVTSAVSRLQSRNLSTNWLFFGTGRYFFEIPAEGNETVTSMDDGNGQRRFFGVKEPCFSTNNTINVAASCTSIPVSLTPAATFPNVSNVLNAPTETIANSSNIRGWFIDLEQAGNYTYDGDVEGRAYHAERVITDPLAASSGVVYFTTYQPYADECTLGGKSFLWAVRYNTGGTPASGLLQGRLLMQVSTANVEQLDLATSFGGNSPQSRGGRRSAAIEGVPPGGQGLSLLTSPPPVRRILHVIER